MRARLLGALGLVVGAVVLGLTVLSGGGPDDRTQADPPAADPGGEPPVTVGLWGDIPYTPDGVPKVARMIEDMNAADLDFSVFDGDIKGGAPCENRYYTEALARFNSFAAPLVYVPGDNEWTDCHATGSDPLERLAHLRRVMFSRPGSLGQRPMPLEHQSDRYPEHTRWQAGGVVFVGLHVVGSNNNKVTDVTDRQPPASRTPSGRQAANAEFKARDAAARAWLRESFEVARRVGAAGVMVVIQANPGFDVVRPEDRAARGLDGFDAFLDVLRDETLRFAKPVALVHGDTHQYRLDHPLLEPSGAPVPNLVRLETFGYPVVSWVKATVDRRDPQVFRFEPQGTY